MVTGSARHFNLDVLSKQTLDLMSLSQYIKERSQPPERSCALPQDVESLTLMCMVKWNRGKTASTCLELMNKKLTDTLASFQKEYRNDTILLYFLKEKCEKIL